MYGSCFLFAGCKEGVSNLEIVTQEVHTPYSLSFLYDYSAIVEGIYQLDASSGDKYWVVGENRTKILLINTENKEDTFSIPVLDTFSDFAVKQNKVYVFTDSFIYKVSVQSKESLSWEKLQAPRSLFSTIFIASNIHCPIEVIDDFSFLIPYRPHQTANPNLLDSFAYMYVQRDGNGEWVWQKIIPYPIRFSRSYELLTGPILTVAPKNNKLFYTFESGKKLFSENIDGSDADSVRMYSSGHAEFDVRNITSMTYILDYTLRQDVNSKMLIDSQGYIYIIRSNNKNNQYKTTITCYDENLKPIDRAAISQKLNPEISFTENGKLYVYVDRSDSVFVSISLKRGRGTMKEEYLPAYPPKEDTINYTNAAKRFVSDFSLENYDSFYLVSCVSCDGCVEDFFHSIKTTNHTLFVVDTTCYVSQLSPIQKGRRIHINRSDMDRYFGYFGNIVLITNGNDKTSFFKVLK
jgi:hypothetical protein